jgi:5-(carboxyamino)imidazole ribonucleotide mutase
MAGSAPAILLPGAVSNRIAAGGEDFHGQAGRHHHGKPVGLANPETLDELGIGHEALIVSAHRTPDRLYAFAKSARDQGFKVVIAGAGGAAHLPGMTAALTPLPVLGVPMPSGLDGQDSLLSIVQMPPGVPVGTLAIGKAGAINAALLAAAVLALSDPDLAKRLDAWRERQTASVAAKPAD